eukprot:4801296-Pyramimonas_sp.AAC.1
MSSVLNFAAFRVETILTCDVVDYAQCLLGRNSRVSHGVWLVHIIRLCELLVALSLCQATGADWYTDWMGETATRTLTARQTISRASTFSHPLVEELSISRSFDSSSFDRNTRLPGIPSFVEASGTSTIRDEERRRPYLVRPSTALGNHQA